VVDAGVVLEGVNPTLVAREAASRQQARARRERSA